MLPKGIMKILITGSAGQLGHDLIDVLGSSNDLYPFDMDLNIVDSVAVDKASNDIKPNIILNAAAYTNVDGCESDSDSAYRVNALGAYNLAVAARSLNIPLLTVGTDFIFDGTKRSPYNEFDAPNPMSIYGRSKLAGETMVREACPEHYIIRTAWLFGTRGNNFVKTMLNLAETKDEIKVVDDQIGSPTFSYDLAGRIAELIQTGWYGTYHVTNSGQASWYEFAKAALAIAGADPEKIKPMSTAELDRPAHRPAYSVLRNYMCELRGMTPMRSFQKALIDFMEKNEQDNAS